MNWFSSKKKEADVEKENIEWKKLILSASDIQLIATASVQASGRSGYVDDDIMDELDRRKLILWPK